ncbi:MAG: hypothetical protein OQK46_06810 [Gammaproteobacteria bacterium]|nr:hypothetical protein [Gammaproteobacteria bacterium]
MCSNAKMASVVTLSLIIALLHIKASAETTIQSAKLNSTVTTNQSSPQELYQQALNYLLGRNNTEKSAEKAASLFKTLAEQNWSSAQHMLGNMYLRGKGVEKNDLLAYKWLSLASKNNMQLAAAIHNKRRQLYENLQNNLSIKSLNKVESWIAEWKPSQGQTHIQLN